MADRDLDRRYREAGEAAELVELLAMGIHSMAVIAGGESSRFDGLSDAAEALAYVASAAVEGAGRCRTLAGSCGRAAGPLLEMAADWTAKVEKTVDAALAVYRRAYSELADCVAVTEEHLVELPSTNAGRLTPAALAEHARMLSRRQQQTENDGRPTR
jgi:hypothetical protein